MKLLFSNKLLVTITCIVLGTTFFTECVHEDKKAMMITNNLGEQFAGSEKCASCHNEIHENFVHTSHNITSRTASEKSIKGTFEDPKNVFQYSYYTTVAMDKKDNGFYQELYFHNTEKTSRRFDVVIGSGIRGQSYGSWSGNRLFQLPVSYLTSADAWCNSPGFPKFEPLFNRRITVRCLECHATYFKDISTKSAPQEFEQNQIIYGVQCESCHGPGEKHVEFQQQNPNEKTGRFIINPASFSRQQKLDLCSYCHNNQSKSSKGSFGFVPGDSLVKVEQVANAPLDTQNIDVHGNQYGLLMASKCFKMSGTLECNSCHNTHQEERGNLKLFSQRCMSCHTETSGIFCKMTQLPVSELKINCIDCHMPKKQSKTLTLELEGRSKNTPATLRSHLITIYPYESKKYINLTHAGDLIK
jgi:Cytochrome c554 and c-prime